MHVKQTWSLKDLKISKKISSFTTIGGWQKAYKELHQLESYAHCMVAQDASDQSAKALQSEAIRQAAHFEEIENELLQKLMSMAPSVRERLLKSDECKDIEYVIREKLELFQKKLTPQKENLAAALAIDGYHSWYQLYSAFAGTLRIPYKGKEYSFAEADNLLDSQDRKERKGIFEAWNKLCKEKEVTFATILNHLSGFRLELYKARKWPVLQESLFLNRMKEKSLYAMWEAVSEQKHHFVKFYKSFKIPKFSWYDQDSVVKSGLGKIPYKEASKHIIEGFSKVSTSLASFAEKALTKGWVDAEERKKKAPGGFCVSLPVEKESRIFMNYAGSFENLLTLAHELGHAYHNEVLFTLPSFALSYPLTLAETASTTAEQLLLDSLQQKASGKDKKTILQYKAVRSAIFFMNIHARFLFETAFYEERQKGPLLAKEISSIMEKAQKEAFKNVFTTNHPYFWITKQHFYFTSYPPFYNFPYTVGYILSLAIVKKARESLNTFENWYKNFLLDTGRMSVEDIISKHFQADACKKTFWKEAIDVAVDDVRELLY